MKDKFLIVLISIVLAFLFFVIGPYILLIAAKISNIEDRTFFKALCAFCSAGLASFLLSLIFNLLIPVFKIRVLIAIIAVFIIFVIIIKEAFSTTLKKALVTGIIYQIVITYFYIIIKIFL